MNLKSRIVLIGQAPGPTGDSRTPLVGGRSGTLLQQLCGLSLMRYCRTFERRNLLNYWPGPGCGGDLFPLTQARRAANNMLLSLDGRRVVMLGKNVAKAFGVERQEPLRWFNYCCGFDVAFKFAIVPHPSGVNRWWNDPDNRQQAARFMRSVVKEAS